MSDGSFNYVNIVLFRLIRELKSHRTSSERGGCWIEGHKNFVKSKFRKLRIFFRNFQIKFKHKRFLSLYLLYSSCIFQFSCLTNSFQYPEEPSRRLGIFFFPHTWCFFSGSHFHF